MYFCDMKDNILSTLRLALLDATEDILEPGRSYRGAGDTYTRLYQVRRGTFMISIDGHEFQPQMQHLVAIPAHSVLFYDCPTEVEIDWVHFQADVLEGLDLFAFLTCPWQIVLEDSEQINALFKRLIRLAQTGRRSDHLEAEGMLMQLLALFVAQSDPACEQRRRDQLARFQQVMSYIERNLADPVRVEYLAELAHLDRAYFSRLFRQHFGMTPKRYLLRRRIDEAQRRLWQTDDTLEQIARQLGFTDAFHLSKTFKNLVGISPREFRQQGLTRTP